MNEKENIERELAVQIVGEYCSAVLAAHECWDIADDLLHAQSASEVLQALTSALRYIRNVIAEKGDLIAYYLAQLSATREAKNAGVLDIEFTETKKGELRVTPKSLRRLLDWSFSYIRKLLKEQGTDAQLLALELAVCMFSKYPKYWEVRK